MIPESRLSSEPVRGSLTHPRSPVDDVSLQWGPVALQDPSQGFHVQLWTARIDGAELYIADASGLEVLWYTHTEDLDRVSLAFDTNARPVMGLYDKSEVSFLRWYDPLQSSEVNLVLTSASAPAVTLDDGRDVTQGLSDVVCAYAANGVLCYRLLRDRFTVEYVPTIGAGGLPAAAEGVQHVSMNSRFRLEFSILGGDGASDAEWLLPDVIKYLADRANLRGDLLSLTQLDWEQVVRGYLVTNEYPCSSAISSLSQVFFFDPASADGMVHFVPRGRSAQANIDECDILESPDDNQKDTRRDTIEIPRILHLQYYDEVAGLNPSIQHSERVEGVRAQGETTIATTITMTSDEAASVVARQHAIIVEQQRGMVEFALSDKHLSLTESDVVEIEIDDQKSRVLITHVELGDGEQRYKAVRDRRAAYSLEVVGVQQPTPTPPPSSFAGPTHIEFLDIPILKDADDKVGFYLVIGGEVQSWPGATVEMSIDNGANYDEVNTVPAGSIMGELVSDLPAHPHWYPDREHTVTVALFDPDESLSNTTLAGMMDRRNRAIVGDEIINFADAQDVSGDMWDISFMLRGRKGTGAVHHSIGERFALLSEAVFIQVDMSLIGKPLTFRATSLGRPLDESTVVTAVFNCIAQVERAPAYLMARRDGSDLIMSWQGVGRLGGGVHIGMGMYFQTYRIEVSDGVTTTPFETTSNNLTVDISGYSGPVTVKAQQRNAITGLGPHIEVIV